MLPAVWVPLGALLSLGVEYDIPVVWVVLNNSGHGMVHTGDLMVFGDSKPWNLFDRRIDVAAVAAGLGAHTHTVDGLRAALDTVLGAGVPTVIDVRVDADEIPEVVRQRANDLFRRFDRS